MCRLLRLCRAVSRASTDVTLTIRVSALAHWHLEGRSWINIQPTGYSSSVGLSAGWLTGWLVLRALSCAGNEGRSFWKKQLKE